MHKRKSQFLNPSVLESFPPETQNTLEGLYIPSGKKTSWDPTGGGKRMAKTWLTATAT